MSGSCTERRDRPAGEGRELCPPLLGRPGLASGSEVLHKTRYPPSFAGNGEDERYESLLERTHRAGD